MAAQWHGQALLAYARLGDDNVEQILGTQSVIPGTLHGLLVEKADLCNQIIGTFLTTGPIATLAPIRPAVSTRQRPH